jgi:hypothetical protein
MLTGSAGQSIRSFKSIGPLDPQVPVLTGSRSGDRHSPFPSAATEGMFHPRHNFTAKLRISEVVQFNSYSHGSPLYRRGTAHLLRQSGEPSGTVLRVDLLHAYPHLLFEKGKATWNNPCQFFAVLRGRKIGKAATLVMLQPPAPAREPTAWMHAPSQPLMRSPLSRIQTPAPPRRVSRFFRVWLLFRSP